MVPAWQDEERGFGFHLSEEDVLRVIEFRKREGRPPLKVTPGVHFLLRGKEWDVFWGFEQFEEQTADLMGCLEVLKLDRQEVFEVDHSSGHAKYLENGFQVMNMNLKVRRRQKVLRDTIMTGGCLGPEEVKMHLRRGLEHAVHSWAYHEDDGLDGQVGRDADHVVEMSTHDLQTLVEIFG